MVLVTFFREAMVQIEMPAESGYYVVRFDIDSKSVEVITSAERDAIAGKQAWLFDGGRYAVDDDRGVSRVSKDVADRWRRIYLQRQQFCDDLGAKFLVALAPTKGRIYPEFLPEWRRPVGSAVRATMFAEMLKGQVDVLDLTPNLVIRKQRGQCFLRFDNHWTGLGALAGAESICEHLATRDQSISRLTFDDYELITEMPSSQRGDGEPGAIDLSALIGLPFLQESQVTARARSGWNTSSETHYDGQLTVHTFTNKDRSLPTAVIYADSFGPPMRHAIAEHFGRAVITNPWYEYDQTKADFPTRIIELERPDYVIYLRWAHAILLGSVGNPPELEAL